MGVDYEKDLINTQENRLSDRISTYYSEPEKDDRTLVSFGGSVKIKDRLTAGLDVERSFGGRYDIKNALNFNLKYTFK
ncbi:autotransporter outer membrane beta-barrel domain-containing protein [Acinetobacter faecalis]|nr:autotransporter outer membrane beta-barrel domain-containing protein [Acinetobacter faecalis]MDY6482213.1 autotransporter outer membrane beta-barrel domain-containing protein [Acinetobacter faecalis]